MTNQFKVLFLLFKYKTNKQGKAPIYCRIIKNKKRTQFSTGFYVLPSEWDRNSQCVINSPLSIPINQYLTAIKAKGIEISLSSKMNEDSISLAGKSYSPATLQKFESIFKQVQQFIKYQYKQNDILLDNLKLKFILDFEYYLLTVKDLKQVTINKNTQRVKKIVKYAIAHALMEKDPFQLHKSKTVNLEVVFLDNEELERLEQYPFEKEIHLLVRDIFVFCCYTGLAFRKNVYIDENNIE